MNLNQIEYFVRVAQAGSFSRAADAVGLSQPSLSRQIRLLELDLGDRLLHRTGRGVALTEAGTCLLAHANTILAEVQATRQHLQAIKTLPTGRIRVGLTASIAKAMTPVLVNGFRKRFPGSTIVVIDGLSAQLREGLLEGEIDLALLYSANDKPRLDLETLMREELVLVCGTHMRAALPDGVAFAALAGFPLVLPCVPNPIRVLLQEQCRRQGVELSVVAEVNAVESLVAMAASSNYFSILPESRAIEAAEEGTLCFAHIHSPRVLNRLSLATRRGVPDSPLAKGVKQMLREALAQMAPARRA